MRIFPRFSSGFSLILCAVAAPIVVGGCDGGETSADAGDARVDVFSSTDVRTNGDAAPLSDVSSGQVMDVPDPIDDQPDLTDTGVVNPRPDAGINDSGTPGRMLAFDGAEGFGAYAEGGRGGMVYTVTNLNDSGNGSFRWAVERPGRRIVQFAVAGVIRLASPIDIRDPYITIDGRGALGPGQAGITIREHTLNIATHDVIIRYIRVRHGDYAVLRSVIQAGLQRPRNSDDLDCINIDRSENVIVDHVSASWSTDEIFSVTNSRNVTVQWSLISEPISNPRAHPYGDNHAFCSNNSASTLTYHHNLFAHYVFRGPQFEANDAGSWRPPNNPSFEAVNNVSYGYTTSGSRLRFGFELASDRNNQIQYYFHFVGNRYVNASNGDSEINAAIDLGIESNIKAYFLDNIGPHRRAGDDQLALVFTDNNAANRIRSNAAALRQVSNQPLFRSTVPVTVQSADAAMTAVLASAGCNIERDAIDQRIVSDVCNNRPPAICTSQANVPGGWPSYP